MVLNAMPSRVARAASCLSRVQSKVFGTRRTPASKAMSIAPQRESCSLCRSIRASISSVVATTAFCKRFRSAIVRYRGLGGVPQAISSTTSGWQTTPACPPPRARWDGERPVVPAGSPRARAWRPVPGQTPRRLTTGRCAATPYESAQAGRSSTTSKRISSACATTAPPTASASLRIGADRISSA